MVFRPYAAYGVLLAPLSKTAKVAVVDATLLSITAGASVNNWCYLRIGYLGKFEVVKVIYSSNGLHICRAQDNTEALAFPAGATVEYTLTAAEIADSVSESVLVFYTYDAIETIEYRINYIFPSINFVGANYLIGKDSFKLDIGRIENAYGCCNGNNDPAPIGGQYFVLTSQLYPIEYIENFTTTASVVRGRVVNKVKDYITSTASLLSGSLISVVDYREYPEYTPDPSAGPDGSGLLNLLQSTAELVEGSLIDTTNYSTLTAPYEAILPNITFVTGSLISVANYIQYTSPPEKLTPTAELISGTLQ